MNLPGSILVSDLLVPHPEYDPKYVRRLQAYFDGGRHFPIAEELRWKEIEKAGGEAATAGGLMRSVRCGTAFYTNYFGDTLLDQVSHICKTPLEIEDPQERLYWVNLAVNCDDAFTSATAQIRSSAADDLLQDRAFYLIKFPPKGPMPGNLQAAIDGGYLDAMIVALPASAITDWKLNDDGSLEWARLYEMELVRTKDYGPLDTERHRWIYWTKTDVHVYEADKPAPKPGQPSQSWEQYDPKAMAKRVTDPQPHSLKVNGTAAKSWNDAVPACPVFKVNRKLSCHMGGKILETAWQLFNEESDASYFRFATLTGAPIINTDDPQRFMREGLSLTPWAAVLLKTGESMSRDVGAASANMFNALDSASAQRRGQMGGLIHTMARQSAAQSASGQNTSRNTGAALQAQQDPLTAFLVGFAEPQLACWKRMANAIATTRQEDISDIEFSGLIGSEDDPESDEEDPGEDTQGVPPVTDKPPAKERREHQDS